MQEQERNKLQLEGGDQDLTLTNGNNTAMILRKAGGSWRNGADDKSLRKSVMAKLYKYSSLNSKRLISIQPTGKQAATMVRRLESD